MTGKVSAMSAESYRSSTPDGWELVRGGQYGKPGAAKRGKEGRRVATRTALVRWADERVHSFFVGVVGATGTVPSEAIHDIRRHRQHPVRYLVRRIEEMADAGVSDDKLDELKGVVAEIVEEAKKRRRNGPKPGSAA